MESSGTWQGRPLAAVLFDLDGTLLDTVDDIAMALNESLAERQLGALSTAAIGRLIGRGAPTLVTRALEQLGAPAKQFEVEALLGRFCANYDRLYAGYGSRALPFPGVEEGLRVLYGAGLKLGVVTNKQRRFAVQLLERHGLARWLDAVVGGDTCGQRKPDPRPLQHACELLQVDVTATLMVGDSNTDVLAARAAGMPVVCVPYGYNEGRGADTLSCDALVASLADLPALLGLAPKT
jgi:phosphoglycolate phosphatase